MNRAKRLKGIMTGLAGIATSVTGIVLLWSFGWQAFAGALLMLVGMNLTDKGAERVRESWLTPDNLTSERIRAIIESMRRTPRDPNA